MKAGRWTLLAVLAVAAGAGALVLAVYVLSPDGQERRPRSASETPAPGPPAPRLAGTDPITGERVALADYRGKPVVLNVWASWCRPCETEADDLRRFALAHPEARVLGIDVQDSVGDAKAFYERWRWTHATISDPDGAEAARLALTRMPTTLVLDRRHRLVARIEGAATFGAFEEAFTRATAAG